MPECILPAVLTNQDIEVPEDYELTAPALAGLEQIYKVIQYKTARMTFTTHYYYYLLGFILNLNNSLLLIYTKGYAVWSYLCPKLKIRHTFSWLVLSDF